MEQDDELELLRQRGDRLTHLLRPLVPFHRFVRQVAQGGGVLQDKEVRLGGRRVQPLGGGLCKPKRPVPGDGVEPRPEPLRLIQLRQRLERQQHRVLGHVIRRVRPHDAGGHGGHSGSEAADQLIKSMHLAEDRALDQSGIVYGSPVQG